MTFSQKDTAKCKGFAILIMLFHHLYADTGRFSDLSIDFWPLSQNTAVQIANFMKICVKHTFLKVKRINFPMIWKLNQST